MSYFMRSDWESQSDADFPFDAAGDIDGGVPTCPALPSKI